MDVSQTTTVKMSGYLHLKKKRMMSSWKNYWFVLEDRLLLYYHSKAEYDAISPCKGSINLGPPTAVKSLSSVLNGFQIETRTVTYTLRAENSEEQKKWMQIILTALNQNQNFSTEGVKKLSHFRYSLDELFPIVEHNDTKTNNPNLSRQNTLHPKHKQDSEEHDKIIQRLQKIGAHSYCGSLGEINKIVGKKEQVPVRSEKTVAENIYERISGESQYADEDNAIYSVPLRNSEIVVKEETFSPLVRETKSLLVENDQYCITRQAQSEEVIYAEPKLKDCNENSVLVENVFYEVSDVSRNSNQSENLYEDLDTLREVVKSNSSQSIVDDKDNKQAKSLKKSKSFIKRVWKKKRKIKENPDNLYAEVGTAAANENSAVQMLSELQNILENKKTEIKAAALSRQNSNQPKEQEKKNENISTPEPPETEICPKLPPKTKATHQEVFRSIDDILEDLDKEKIENGKVQVSIEQFDEVILRENDCRKYIRYSNDLNVLLDELAKVTSAPIMTPGVTTSLVNPNVDEWLLSKRRRRLSEPDYDVPRLLNSLQIGIGEKKSNEIVIPATRFFGSIILDNNKDDSLFVSMTPDSLEVETENSYTSHINNLPQKHYYQPDNKVIYALPKSYVSVATHIVNTCQNICCGKSTDECMVIYKTVKNVDMQEEIFGDSLELCNKKTLDF